MPEMKRTAPNSLRERPSFLLSQLGYLSDARFGQMLVPLGINARQVGLLRILAGSGWRTQQQLSEELRVHRNVMVGMIDELEQRGLVERRRHPIDRRAHAIHLTDAAKSLLPRIEATLDECDDGLLSALTPADRKSLIALLQRVADGAGLIPGVHPGYDAIEPADRGDAPG